ncbi:MAG: SIS domain-containing protein [Desulfobacterales bacterium]|jgi:glucosamine--fructose-6-phosphate aminotransferase (isomerizing)|nr:SIS domain-containing protein [Desulfobacterales bacterium]
MIHAWFFRLGSRLQRAAARCREIGRRLAATVYFGRAPATVPPGAIVLFPLRSTLLGCGIAGIVAFNRPAAAAVPLDRLTAGVEQLKANGLEACRAGGRRLAEAYLGGEECIAAVGQIARELRRPDALGRLYADASLQARLAELAAALAECQRIEAGRFEERVGRLSVAEADIVGRRIEQLKDAAWCLANEVLGNITRVRELAAGADRSPEAVKVFRGLNSVLNSIDRMEVRGRDSAGISLLFMLPAASYERFCSAIGQAGLQAELDRRMELQPLLNRSIAVQRHGAAVAVAFTYKVAVEIGSLGDNIRFLRREIAADRLLHAIVSFPAEFHTVNAHTRWASVGAITEANCHPVDNRSETGQAAATGIIHACLNGDIDNFLELKEALERQGERIPQEVTTDTKIIPLQVESYLRQGYDVAESFRRAVCDFKGSHAIAMHTSLAPGRLFLAQRGSGQAIFVGIAPDHYMATSEVYGFIEETSAYIRLDGESVVEGPAGKTQGQIVVLDQSAPGGLQGIRAMRYDGAPVALGERDLKRTELTSRDIDRQHYPHYFLKEVSESPASVEKTLQNRWKISDSGDGRLVTALDEKAVPAEVNRCLAEGAIRRIFFIGQGTAGVAALACAHILQHYLDSPAVHVQALKASEFSGFSLRAAAETGSMADALVVAISQSGTTTDTNRAVDMVRERGARTLAIVNRRDSDITFKVDGVIYTSSGRDIEMSVASTKAFYAQITAGALLGLHIAHLKGRRDAGFVSEEIQRLLALPGHMRRVLGLAERLKDSAQRLAVAKTYWAVVGSGPNKASADEIRIKLSELCYKTISSDFVEDKKHIDLSAEPLIVVCAAGTRPSVIGDIVKDTAIFKAHKAIPVVICNEGEDRFAPYAADVFQVPVVAEHLAPVLNTLAGHLWGYYAALSIHAGSQFLFGFHEEVQRTISEATRRGVGLFELVGEKRFRAKVAEFYAEFRERRSARKFPVTVGYDASSDLTLLLKYLAGRLPAADFDLDFRLQGTAANMLTVLLERLGDAIGFLARPVDAIKHQAKTVTVGTSRISEEPEGMLFAALAAEHFSTSHLIPANVAVLKNLQAVVREVQGTVLYRIAGLTVLGEPDDTTTIEILGKRGGTSHLPSRVESDPVLKGTKRIIVRDGNIYIGKGRKDDRSILVIPLMSAAPARPNRIEHLLLLHIGFQDPVPLAAKIRALGGKHEHIKNIVQENSVPWSDALLERVAIDELFGRSAEKVAEFIIAELNAASR